MSTNQFEVAEPEEASTQVAPEGNVNKTQESQIDSELLQQSLFLNEQGEQYVFFIPVAEEDRDNLVNLIEANGGKVSDDPGHGYYISKFGEIHHDVIDPRFIYDSVENKKVQATSDYKVFNQAGTNDADRDNVQHLVTYLHENKEQPSAPMQHEQQQPLHPKRAETNHQSTNKNSFTAEEDETILEEVRRNPTRRSTHTLYHEIAKKIGRHTGNSIRYRFRNHLLNRLSYVYKADAGGNLILDSEGNPQISEDLPSTVKNKFTSKDDYELCKAVRENLMEKPDNHYSPDPKDIVLPGKFFEAMTLQIPTHTKAAWRDRYRKFAVPYGIDKYIEYYESELAAGNTPLAMKNFTGKKLYPKRTAENIDEVVGERLTEHNDQYKKRKAAVYKTPNPESNNLFENDGQAAELMDSDLFEGDAAAAVAAASKVPNDTGLEHLTEDLVSARFFEFQPIITVVKKVSEIVDRNYESGDAENLISALYAEAGIQKKFGTFIITSVCGDLALIPKYVKLFLERGENPPSNVHGIWTSRDDEYLTSGDPEKLEILKKLHGEKRIELRRQFINQDLV